MSKKLTGLEPRGFRWVIKDRLATSERIGGYGFQHRRVRREEEIIWLTEQGIKVGNPSQCVKQSLLAKRVFAVERGRYRISQPGEEYVRRMLGPIRVA